MGASTNQPAKHETPLKTSDEQPKDTQTSENNSTKSPAKTECNDDARQTLKHAGNGALELKTTPEDEDKPFSPPEAKQSDAKGDDEPRPKASDGDASAKATEDKGSAQEVSEIPVAETAQRTQALKVKEASSVEKASTENQPTSQQKPKSSETEPQSDEFKSKDESVDEPMNSTSEKLNSDLRGGDLVKDESKLTTSQRGGAERGAVLLESPVEEKAEHELPSGNAEQHKSSAQKFVQQHSEQLSQVAPKSTQDDSKSVASIPEKAKPESTEQTSETRSDPTPEGLTLGKPSQDIPSRETPTRRESSPQERPSQDNSPREKAAQVLLSQVLPSLGGHRNSEVPVQKGQSQIKNESDSPSQKEVPSEKRKEEASVKETPIHPKSFESRPAQQAKTLQQTEMKDLQPQETRIATRITIASQNEKQEVKQNPNHESAQVRNKSATVKQTLLPQSIQQTQQQKSMGVKPTIQKQAPAAAQRLTRVPLAATLHRAHQPTRVSVSAKTTALVGKAAAKPAGTSTKTNPAPSQNLSNAQQSSRALQVARLVVHFLGPNHPPPQNPQLPTLNSLRTRLFADPNHYDSRADQLAWQTREAIRTEFFKVLYPAPPPSALLTLVTSTESIFAPFQPRPFFFPGARVAVPTEAGSRRAATSLQLRFKQVDRSTVAEALLHLDGPNGGGFQWVQAPALTPLSLYAPQSAKAVQKKTKRPRAPRPAKPRKKKEKALPPAPPVPPRPISKPTVQPNSRPAPTSSAAPTQTQPRTHTKTQTSTHLQSQAPKPTRTSAPTPTPSPAPQPIPAPRLAGVVARLARQEASGVYVPDALRGTSPPPRARIVGEGRFLSHVSGTMRSAAFDIDKVLGIERLVARRGTDSIEYFVKWSGIPLREGSWESRDALLQDVPGLIRDFDVRHPEKKRYHRARGSGVSNLEEVGNREAAQKEATKTKDERDDSSEIAQNQKLARKRSVSGEIVSSLVDVKHGSKDTEGAKKEGEDKKDKTPVKEYIDDVTGLPIPSWLDTPIVELNIAGMVLQIRRPNEAVLHNDATSAVRDAKKRQTRFKQENILHGERLFPLTKPEAKSVIDAAAKDHRYHNRVPIPFPRGIGRVSPTDHGYPFALEDVLKAPPSWEAYFVHIGMVPTDYTRSLPPHMPTLDDAAQSKLARASDELAFSTACEHRERARLLLRESFRHTGAPPPEHIFRDGVRAPPGEHSSTSKKRGPAGKSGEGNSRGLLRAREPVVEAALKKAKKLPTDKKGAWFDETWACWRPAPS